MVQNIKPHKTIHVEWNELEEDIDERIAPLILEIWKAGLHTYNSCEENQPGIMWIEFAHARHAELFLNIVARYEEGVTCLYNRMRSGWQDSNGGLTGKWEYEVRPFDYAVEQTVINDTIEENYVGPASNFLFSFSIRFPQEDYPVLLERMQEYNK